MRVSPPLVVGVDNPGYVFIRKLPCAAVDQMPQLARVYEQDLILAFPVAVVAVPFVGDKPQAGGDLRVQEQFCRQIDNAVHNAGVDDVFADDVFVG